MADKLAELVEKVSELQVKELSTTTLSGTGGSQGSGTQYNLNASRTILVNGQLVNLKTIDEATALINAPSFELMVTSHGEYLTLGLAAGFSS